MRIYRSPVELQDVFLHRKGFILAIMRCSCGNPAALLSECQVKALVQVHVVGRRFTKAS
jgi:hypothetical protein